MHAGPGDKGHQALDYTCHGLGPDQIPFQIPIHMEILYWLAETWLDAWSPLFCPGDHEHMGCPPPIRHLPPVSWLPAPGCFSKVNKQNAGATLLETPLTDMAPVSDINLAGIWAAQHWADILIVAPTVVKYKQKMFSTWKRSAQQCPPTHQVWLDPRVTPMPSLDPGIMAAQPLCHLCDLPRAMSPCLLLYFRK
jgi:hypothetical protein